MMESPTETRMGSPTGAMSPVVELSGAISEVEDLPSAIMQSFGSTASIRDEDEYIEGRLEVTKREEDAGAESTRARKKRLFAMALTLVTLFAGCGYLVTSRELAAKDSDGKGEQGGLSALSLPTPPNPLNITNTSRSATPAPSLSPEYAPPAPLSFSEIQGESLVLSGSAFQIQLRRVNVASASSASLCLDLLRDGTATAPSSDRTLAFRECSDSPSTSQAFVYDPSNYFIMSKTHSGMCVDSDHFGDAGLSEAAALRLHPCGLKAWNQWFQFAPNRGEIKSTHLGLCIADGAPPPGSNGLAQTPATLKPCVSPPNTQLRSVMTRIWDVTHPLLLSGDQFLLRSVGKLDLCLLTTAANGIRDTGLLVTRCNSSQEDQRLTYNARMHQIQSAGNPALCLDSDAWLPGANDTGGDSNAAGGGNALARMAPCNELSSNQKFVYDAFARTFRSPAKPLLCLDDGGGYFPRASAFRVTKCDIARGNQQFALNPVVVFRPLELLQETQEFVIESVYKGLCLAADFRLRECDRDAPAQRFTYDSTRQALHSAAEPSHCWSHSAAPLSASSFGVAFLALERCDAASVHQRFVVDTATSTLKSSSAGDTGVEQQQLCLDGGGGWFPAETPVTLRVCAAHSQRQQFRIRGAS